MDHFFDFGETKQCFVSPKIKEMIHEREYDIKLQVNATFT